jgi:hypothetical protein
LDRIAKKLEFMERRLTLLEHEIARLKAPLPAVEPLTAPPAAPPVAPHEPVIKLSCDSPGVIISTCYRVEHSAQGEKFVWVGNNGPIQIVLPIIPHEALTCRLFIWPHPNVDIANLRLTVNDLPCDHEISRIAGGLSQISMHVAMSAASKINITIFGVTSVRPCDDGVSADSRLLAFEFFGAEGVFDSPNMLEGA